MYDDFNFQIIIQITEQRTKFNFKFWDVKIFPQIPFESKRLYNNIYENYTNQIGDKTFNSKVIKKIM